MKKNYKLGIIGAGFMATAIINGIITSKILNKNQIIVSARNADSLKKFEFHKPTAKFYVGLGIAVVLIGLLVWLVISLVNVSKYNRLSRGFLTLALKVSEI